MNRMLHRFRGRRPPVRSTRVVSLGTSHSMEIRSRGEGAVLRISSPERRHSIEVEIALHEGAPVVRVRAPSVELEAAERVAVRCHDFEVQAKGTIALQAGGMAQVESGAVSIRAQRGCAVVRANDDVQLLGEKVLLNCERQSPMPTWVETPDEPALLPLEPATGDAALLLSLTGKDAPLLRGPDHVISQDPDPEARGA